MTSGSNLKMVNVSFMKRRSANTDIPKRALENCSRKCLRIAESR